MWLVPKLRAAPSALVPNEGSRPDARVQPWATAAWVKSERFDLRPTISPLFVVPT
jgi:hypothetical protein